MPSARHLGGQNSCCKGNNMNKASQGQCPSTSLKSTTMLFERIDAHE